jgi:hypothetical protein
MPKIILTESAPELILAPINLDAAIQELQIDLKENLPWLKRSYGRARIIPELQENKLVRIPKVYYGKGEYLNVLANDNFRSSSWFQLTGPEIPVDYGPLNPIQRFLAPLSLIVYYKMDQVKPNLTTEDYLHSEMVKRDVFNIINKYPALAITRMYDENASDIFREYSIEDYDQLLTWPKAALRFDFTLMYNYQCLVP